MKINLKTLFYFSFSIVFYKLNQQNFDFLVCFFSLNISKKEIGLIIDDIATLPQKIIEKYQIGMVKTKFFFPELKNFPGKNLYQVMMETKAHPKTSAPPPGDYLKAYKNFSKIFKKILVITLSKSLSATWSSARQAKILFSEPEKITIIDSKQAAAGEGLFVLRAKELIEKKLKIEEVEKELLEERKNFKLFGFIKTTYWVEKIGRMSSWQGKVFHLLKNFGVQPILGIKKSGVIGLTGFKFWTKEALTVLFNQLKKEAEKGKIKVAINYTDNFAVALKLKEKVEKDLKGEVAFISEVPPIIGANSGPGTLIVASFIYD